MSATTRSLVDEYDAQLALVSPQMSPDDSSNRLDRRKLSRLIDPFGTTPVRPQRKRPLQNLKPFTLASSDTSEETDSRPFEERTEIDVLTPPPQAPGSGGGGARDDDEDEGFGSKHRRVLDITYEDDDDDKPTPPARSSLASVIDITSERDDIPRQVSRVGASERLKRLVEGVLESSYVTPQPLSRAQAVHVVTTMWLAQLVLSPATQFYLVVASEPVEPHNQLGTIERDVFARINVAADLKTLVSTGFKYDQSGKFGLKCRFTVGRTSQQGLRTSTARFPFCPTRPNALAIPWQSYNPAAQTEVQIGDDGRQYVSFIDAPNLALHGDSFYMCTTRNTGLFALLGTSPNEPEEQDDELRQNQAHFYDRSFTEEFENTGPSMHDVPAAAVIGDGPVANIDITNVPYLSKEQYENALRDVMRHVTTPKRLHRVMEALIVDREQLI